MSSATTNGGRQAVLILRKVNPWSVLRLAFLLSVAMGVIAIIAATAFWLILNFTGVFAGVDGMLRDALGARSAFSITDVVGLGPTVAIVTILAIVHVVLITVFATLAALLFNVAASLVGGIGVTLTDN